MTAASSTSQSNFSVPIGMWTVSPSPTTALRGRLHKEEQPLLRLLRPRHSHLGQMVEIVGARAQDLARIEQGRETADGLDAVRRIEAPAACRERGSARGQSSNSAITDRHPGIPTRASEGSSAKRPCWSRCRRRDLRRFQRWPATSSMRSLVLSRPLLDPCHEIRMIL